MWERKSKPEQEEFSRIGPGLPLRKSRPELGLLLRKSRSN